MKASLVLFAGWLTVLLFASGHGQVVRAQAPSVPPSSPVTSYRALLDQYCVTCHNQRLKTAGLALDTVNLGAPAENAEIWEKVVRKLRGGVMPPVGRPRPTPQAADALVAHLETALDQAAVAANDPGRPDTMRRLTRTEYHNAIRDLLALDIDVSTLLPQDSLSLGFDNISVGDLSPAFLERYLSVAKMISREAIGAPVRSPVAETILIQDDVTQDEHIDGLPFGTRGGAVVRHTFPLDAEYVIQVGLGRGEGTHFISGLFGTHELEVTVDGERVQLFTVEPQAGEATIDLANQIDAKLRVQVPVKAGPRVVGVTFLKKSSALIETDRQPWLRRLNTDAGDQRTQPVVFSVQITGPFNATGAGDTPSRRRIFKCRPAREADEPGCARTILTALARQAYRRPATQEELTVLLDFYRDGRTQGDFETGIETALRALLASPRFLFRIEQEPETVAQNTPYRISDLELATRLSSFLWSSIPDEELLDVASRGTLKNPKVLELQVRRMLADERSEALVGNFAGQWLYLRNLAQITPDPRLFPDFDDLLRQGFRRETELFFGSILRENRSVRELLSADYTFLNERVARHYGIPGVYGSWFRRVPLTDVSRRGLLGQGSILTVTSYVNRTSPVLRGKWILENILGTPPPDPPPNVPPLPQKEQQTPGELTMRQRMAQHRANPVCASCHNMIDPAGFALEYFDAVGKYRALDGAFNAIDGSGALPDGTQFKDVVGLRAALLTRPDRLVSTVTEKMLIYALGRALTYHDMPAVRRIVREAAPGDYKLSSIVLGIINSTPFQMRRSAQS